MAEHSGPIIGTCDACAQGPKPCRMDPKTEAYVCEDCDAFHERAIGAAAKAVLYEHGSSHEGLPDDDELWTGLARTAVDAYLAYEEGEGQ